MPRVSAAVAARGGGSRGAKRGGGAKGYKQPERLPSGTELKAVGGTRWKLHTPLARGGFGEIYAASPADSSTSAAKATHVVKIEPHENGPLFVEMHFYMRNSKKEDIDEFIKSKKLKYLGVPLYIASGSHEYNDTKYRFVVMERYGKDLWHKFLECGRLFNTHTVFRIAIQMLYAYEYIHGRTYIHADLKGANILFGIKKGEENQAYLVDFGLACHYTIKDFKVDPKKAHDGTIEYTSRDAHNGVPTRRGDMEILGYNLVQWLTGSLPWETDLRHPKDVQAQKEKYMSDIPSFLKKTFNKSAPPHAITSYLNYVSKMEYDDTPDYKACRAMFESGLKSLGYSNTCNLDFTPVKSSILSPKSKKLLKDEFDSSDFDSPKFEEPEVVKVDKRRKLGPTINTEDTNGAKSKKKVLAKTKNSSKDSEKNMNSSLSSPNKTMDASTDIINSTLDASMSLRSHKKGSILQSANNTASSVDIFEDSCIPTPPKALKRKHKKRFEVEFCSDEEVTVHTTVKKKCGSIKEEIKSWKKFPTILNGKMSK